MTQELSFKYKFFIIFTSIFLMSGFSESAELDKRISYFKKQCDKPYEGDGGNEARPNKLLLIDATDPLSESQKQFLRDNFIDNFKWKNEGEKVSVVLLNNTNTNNLAYVTLCTPIPEDKITFTMAKKREKNKIILFEKTLKESFERFISSDLKAEKTVLIEALIEIYRNSRYDFLEGRRHLIIASDLYQNSNWLSFFRICPKENCLSYERSLKDKNFAKFVKSEVKIKVKDSDEIEIYHLKLKDKVVLSAKDWWKDFLKTFNFNVEN